MMNNSFSLVDDDIHRYQDKLCVPDIDDLRTKIVAEDMIPNIRYILVPPRFIMTLSESTSGMA